MRFGPAFDPRRTEFLSRMVEKCGHFEGVLTHGSGHHMYGYIGMSDRRMVCFLRPGSIVLMDASIRKIDDGNWTTEHDRPMYFAEIRNGYRCGWFYQDGSRLVMQPHVGRVTGIVTRLNGPGSIPPGESPVKHADSNRKDP
jgi:hypothetical protein